ncbi:MAG: GAK system CofD-like protein [Gemmatimonadota bacterium]
MGSDPTVRVSRAARIPDSIRLARFRHAPELGARVLFFSGGTALRGVSRCLVDYTHHSRHLITPFDSGGSSAHLRRAFRMPAVGDLRNRLMALADQSVLGNPEIYHLFAFRFPKEASDSDLRSWLSGMVRGVDPQIRAIPEPMRSIITSHLGFFQEAMPKSFDLAGAAIGNLVLAGGYLNQGRKLDSVLYLFSQLVEVRGVVRPVVDRNLHLVAHLEDGTTIVGQHLMTGKEVPPLDSPVIELHVTKSLSDPVPYRPRIGEAVDDLIRTADLICYPMGSFYTSIVATLLPEGVSDAIAATDVPKVYVPNPGRDPEELGMGLLDKVRTLERYLTEGVSGRVAGSLLDIVLLDRGAAGVTLKEIRQVEKLGVRVLDVPLVSDEQPPMIDDRRLAEALLSLA